MSEDSNSTQNHLYLVDGSAYIFRAYYSLPPLTNPNGVPVGAVSGYSSMLWKLANDLHAADGPTHMAVVLDKAGTSFRNDIYDQYKANRPPAPDDLRPQFPLIRDATRAFSLPMVEEDNVEADDMIAAYTVAAVAKGWHVTIISSDKDLMQLVRSPNAAGTGGVDMFDTMKDRRIGCEEVEAKFGVGPELVGDVLALMGDSSDNVPGVPGIGPKTATKLITEFGNLDGVLSAAPAMKPSKMRDNLIEYADMARLSKVLVTLKEDCPLPIALEDMVLGPIPEEPLRPFLEEHGFKSLLNRIGKTSNTLAANKAIAGQPSLPTTISDAAISVPKTGERIVPAPMSPIDVSAYVTVTTLDALDDWIARARAMGYVAFDTETDSLEAVTAQLIGFSMAIRPGEACYVPLQHGGTDMFAQRPEQIDMADALARIKQILEDDSILKIGQNLKYDMSVLAQHNIAISPFDDTMVMSFNLDAGANGHGMNELAKLHLNHDCITYKSVTGAGKSQISFAEVPVAVATRYAAEDADVTLRLWHHLKLRIAPEGASRIYELVDRPSVPVLSQMECAGIMVDRTVLARLSAEFAEQGAVLEKEIHALADEPFLIASPAQLGKILFEKMGYKGGKKGKSGQYSTDVTILEDLASQGVTIAGKVLEWRQLAKLKSTYTDSLQAQINPKTGRVHTSYSLVGAQTGRLSSTDPNLQNIPIRTEMGRQIRDAFVAEPGNVILAADYSQIELRLAAHIADVPALRDAFEAGEDIHARTARELFGEVNRDTRGRAKTINFSILYGISRWGLAKRLESTPDEAQVMIDAYYKSFPGISRYMQETLESVREKGYSETLFGRKCWFPRITSANGTERQGSERAAINAPIQGTSADIIKRAMARMNPALAAAGLPNVRMLLQVHDELVFELPETDVAAASKVIEAVMVGAAEPLVKLTVPLGVDIGIGKSWGAAH